MQELDDYLNRVKHLPPAPRILPELLTLLRQDDVDASRVVKLITYDPSLTAGVLKLSNSAFFGGAMPASDLSDAITRLGFQQVYQLVAAVSGSRALSPAQKGYGLNAGELWKHSVASAVAARLIANKLGDDESLVFTAALLHDIGKIVLADALEHIYGKLLEESQRDQQALLETEKKLLGVQHAEIGARLLARWKFPENLVSAVCFHHDPKGGGANERLAAYVYLGNMIAYFMGYGYGHQAFALRGRADALDILKLTGGSLPHFMIQTFDQLQLVEALLSVNT